jgi:F-type H+-transporting ATPase subunit delta
MPLIESPPDAVAEIYARSIFDLSFEKGGQSRAEQIAGELEALLDLARQDKGFGEFLASRILSVETREASLQRILAGRCDELTRDFLLTLNRKGRLGHLPAIAAALDQIIQERFGRVEVDVFTAAPMGQAEMSQIRDRLGAALKKDVVIHPYTDESMIGGVRFRIVDQLVDASISSQLRRIRDQLAREGAANLRGRIRDVLGE